MANQFPAFPKPLAVMLCLPSAQGAVKWACCRLATVVLLTFLVFGCGLNLFGPASVAFTFDNRTDATLCKYPSPQDAAAARCLTELEPRDETGSGGDCDGSNSRPITVVITVKQGGRQIYSRTATCGEWHDTDRTFIIEQVGEEFIVTEPEGL